MSSETALLERADIHRSAKALESLIAVFYDFCQSSAAVASARKKLSKALRDAAAVKGTGSIPSNAMASSALVFDSLADVDSKLAKLAEREYESLSSEIKKWFKKMAKEEKAHDDFAYSANTKIKQAAQVYEKKAKKKDRDAAAEHTRYVDLLSTLGADMAQAKSSHMTFVSQKHTSTLYSVGACLSRVADAEWADSCERVRKCAPSMGKLGEWRAFCEGGWTGPVPDDLVVIDKEEILRERLSTDGRATPLRMDTSSNVSAEVLSDALKLTTSMSRTESRSQTNSAQPSPRAKTPVSLSPASPQDQELPSTETNGTYRASQAQKAGSGRGVPSTDSDSSHLSLPSTKPPTNTSPAAEPSLSPATLKSPPPAVPQNNIPAEREYVPSLSSDTLPPPRTPQPLYSPRTPFEGRVPYDARRQSYTVHRPPSTGPLPPQQYSPPSNRVPPPENRMDRSMSIDSTASTRSQVAALRDYYDERGPTPASPPPRAGTQFPRPGIDMGNRYQPGDLQRPYMSMSPPPLSRDNYSAPNLHQPPSYPPQIPPLQSQPPLRQETNWEQVRRTADWEATLRERQRELDEQENQLQREGATLSRSGGAPTDTDSELGYAQPRPTHASTMPTKQSYIPRTASPLPIRSNPDDLSETNVPARPRYNSTGPQPPPASSKPSVDTLGDLPNTKPRGTWIGKGLRRLSMPIGVSDSSDTKLTPPNPSPPTAAPPLREIKDIRPSFDRADPSENPWKDSI